MTEETITEEEFSSICAECEECWHIVDTYIPTGQSCIKKRN